MNINDFCAMIFLFEQQHIITETRLLIKMKENLIIEKPTKQCCFVLIFYPG